MGELKDIKETKYKDQIAALRQIKEEMVFLLEYQVIDARLRWEKYRALLKEGFNEQQALELTKEKLFDD